ncbi:MAG: glycosyl transferase [Spirochaetaceae bacterium]|nr:MAG: glycosyl transferase [Spirochaetaceae bacterium]
MPPEGKTVKPATLTAFFIRRQEAEAALRTLKRSGYHRAALVHRDANGRITIHAPLWRRGSTRGQAKELSRRLAVEESALVMQEPIASLLHPAELLRRNGENPPIIFILNPAHAPVIPDLGTVATPCTLLQIQERARHLAANGRVSFQPTHDTVLLVRLKQMRKWIGPVSRDLSGAAALGLRPTPIIEWILDNQYMVDGAIRDVQQNLSRRFYRELPILNDERSHGLPRIYVLARQLAGDTSLRIDRETIVSFVEAYQSVEPLTTAELWAMPQMLRLALVEGIVSLASRGLTELRDRETADFWANRLITADRRDPNHLFPMMAELTDRYATPGPHFAFQLLDHLYGEESCSVLVRSWLERVFRRPIEELNSGEQDRQAKEQIAVGNAFTSLRELTQLDWRDTFEEVSHVERLLRLDPAGVYPGMDFATRDRYRRAIEQNSRRCGQTELQVAQAVIDLACEAAAPGDEQSHIGIYLAGGARNELSRRVGARMLLGERMRFWATRHHSAVYLSAVGLFSALLAAPIIRFGVHREPVITQVAFLAMALLPLSQLAVEIVNYLVLRFFPPRALSKMDFKDAGIPDTFRTLVVVPMMLVDTRTIDEQIARIEIRYLANRDQNLLFSLFTDYTDWTEQHRDNDETLLQRAIAGLEALNARYGNERFFLLHRQRVWSESEQAFIGWERKRGKLEELNTLIDGSRRDDAGQIVYLGDPDRLREVRFVITLDSDTQLPAGTARRMVETLAHPLNQPQIDDGGRIVAGTYTIIQPRVSPSLPSSNGSPFSRLFSNAVGIDPYTRVISDVNQDLTAEGSYHGKGIYDVRAFSRVLSRRFRDSHLLSHDLIEGAHVRVGLASDIDLLDEFPQDYLSFSTRQHRWIRGDWQIADWILPRVRDSEGRRSANELSAFNRWKIADNLRRSVIPLASMGLLAVAWLGTPRMAVVASIIVAAQLLFNTLMPSLTMATTRDAFKSFSLSTLGHDLLRTLAEASLIPHQSVLAADAIIRVWYRRLVSHKNLLEWTVNRSSSRRTPTGYARMYGTVGLTSLLSLVAGWALITWMPAHALFAAPWLVVWIGAPLTTWLLSRPPAPPQSRSLPAVDVHFLRSVARRTWRYYAEFVSSETSWLPPDNFQTAHQNRLAMRTSPTNIGLWMLSAVAARDFGYLTTDQVTEILSKSMKTVGSLERFEGHLLNWYDIQTLAPLEPRYVSTVDSGNLLASLWALESALHTMVSNPVLDTPAFNGLLDTLSILTERAGDHGPRDTDARRMLTTLKGVLEETRENTADKIRVLRQLDQVAHQVSRQETESPTAESAYWLQQFREQASAWMNVCARYLGWIEIAAEQTPEDLALLGDDAATMVRLDLTHAPSLESIAAGTVDFIRMIATRRDLPHIAASPLAPWIDRVLQAFHDSQWLAGEALATARVLLTDVQRFAASINMRFLYNPLCKLFRIGFNVTEHRPDNAYYDLLASEARIGSYVAVARGDVPVEHWFTMARPHNAIGRRRVLLSWTGTMFEYLMPQLLLHSYQHSLLNKAAAEAVAIQIEYGRAQRVPWGISESAFSDLDGNKTYQYKAFGIPALALKRGLDKELVVAPYACLLALGIAPTATVKNLRRLISLGLFDTYGYYDAIDFSRQARRDGGRGVIVRTYMSHHQGMSFLSLSNYLHEDAVRNHFHRNPRVRAFEPLLHESIPVGVTGQRTTRDAQPPVATTGDISTSPSTFDSPNTATPKTQLLGNGRYSTMITNAGGGYSQWRAVELTRWRADATRDSGGVFCYVHEPDADRLWSNTYHPTCGSVTSYNADFALDRAVIRRVDNGIELKTEIVISPEDDVEIRRITLINRSLRSRRLDLTSYIEVSLAPHQSDVQHPAFNKLFIQTEAHTEHRALLAYRRLRREDEQPVCIGHRVTWSNPADEKSSGLSFETDRASFIGRGRSLANPIGAVSPPGGTQGFVLDPILSLRARVELGPGEQRQLSLIVAAGESQSLVLELLDKYKDPHAIDRAMDFAWASAQIELRSLRIQPDEARRFQQIASHLLFPNSRLRPAAQRLAENRKGQSALWAYGISGDAPITLLRIADLRDVDLVRQMLRAQSYWRLHGFTTDLVILNEESSGYDNPLRTHLDGMVRAHGTGAFLVNADQLPREDVVLLTAVARVVLIAARGALPQQLGVAADPPESSLLTVKKRTATDVSAELPFMELHYFNGLGGFTDHGREYAIYLGEDSHTPAPWVNIIANPHFGTLVGETGAGFTWYGNSQRNRLTAWSNDPVVDPASEAIFVRDEETGAYWSPTASPIRERTAYRARHGAGYSVFEHNSHGIEQELTVFVPMNDEDGEPVKLQRLRLKNTTTRVRTLSVTHYLEWTLGENRESSAMHITTSWDDTVSALLARNRYHPEYGDRLAFAAMTPSATTYSADRTMFLGRNRALARPAAMERTTLAHRVGAGLDPCSALQTTVSVAPGASAEVVLVVGQAESLSEARELVRTYENAAAFETSLVRTRTWWDDLLGTIEVETPEHAANFLINRWLLYQSLSCRMWARSATYQSGGAFGFRDQLQDAMAFVYTRPEVARRQILLAAGRQFVEGDVQHWWHPPGGAGIRSRISDDLLWLPYVVAQYVRVTGDRDILARQVSFLDAPPLNDNEHEVFATPRITTEHGSVFEHCLRAVQRGLTSGPRGLPLMGTGDWNDGMNLVGAEGRGESVWLAWFLVDVLCGMRELCGLQNESRLEQAFEQQRNELIQRIEATAWDGAWYLRAFFDNGTPLGSVQNVEARIDSLPQSWARLTGAGNQDRTMKAVESAWEQLVRPDEGLVLLFDPPFDTSEPSPGYIRGYPPGVRENGGQYTHAALWFAMAVARGGGGERAADLLRILNPIEKTRNLGAVWRYAVEPYVIAADVYRVPGRIGRGGWSWYTGSAAWMYRAWVEEVLGLQIRGDQMRLEPVIPAWWDGFTLRYRHGQAVYELRVANPHNCEHGVARIEMDGQLLEHGVIQLERTAAVHHILVTMGIPLSVTPSVKP